MKQLGILLPLPGWDASPLQGYPQHDDHWYPFIYLGEKKQCVVPESIHTAPMEDHWKLLGEAVIKAKLLEEKYEA